jgi:hypothetical protein
MIIKLENGFEIVIYTKYDKEQDRMYNIRMDILRGLVKNV